MTEKIKCPCCVNSFETDSEQAICVESFGECIFCRFSPNSKGSTSGTQAELSEIVVKQEVKRRFKNQQPKVIDMEKFVAGPVVVPPKLNQFKPDYNTEAVLVEEMQRMAKRIEDLEMLLTIRAEQIVGLQDEIRNLTGEE